MTTEAAANAWFSDHFCQHVWLSNHWQLQNRKVEMVSKIELGIENHSNHPEHIELYSIELVLNLSWILLIRIETQLQIFMTWTQLVSDLRFMLHPLARNVVFWLQVGSCQFLFSFRIKKNVQLIKWFQLRSTQAMAGTRAPACETCCVSRSWKVWAEGNLFPLGEGSPVLEAICFFVDFYLQIAFHKSRGHRIAQQNWTFTAMLCTSRRNQWQLKESFEKHTPKPTQILRDCSHGPPNSCEQNDVKVAVQNE